MATFAGAITNNQIILTTWLSIPGQAVNQNNPNAYRALVDTGAQVTAVSQKVVTAMGLISTGNMPITPVTGQPVSLSKFRVRIDIPITSAMSLPGGGTVSHNVLSGKDIDVGLLPYQPPNHDVLLGMDFLFGFHLTIYGNNFILSN